MPTNSRSRTTKKTAAKKTANSSAKKTTTRKKATKKKTTRKATPRWSLSEAQMEAARRSFAVIEFELDGTIIDANENFLGCVGYELDEIVGQHHRLFVQDDFARSKEYHEFWNDLGQGEFMAGEFQRIGKDGSEIWIQASYNPVFDKSGEPVRVIKFAVDITAQKREKADSDGQISAIGKSQAVIEFNMDGTIITANESFLAATGYTLEQIQGNHHRMFMPTEAAASREYAQFWDDLRDGKFQSGQYKRVGNGGNEIWIQASYNPIFDENGVPFKVVKYASDITEETREKFETKGQLSAIDKSQAVIEFELDGTIIDANENFLAAVGYTLDEIQGKHHRMFVDAEYSRTEEYRRFWVELADGEFHSGQFKRFGKQGNEIWIQASYNPIFDPNGEVYKVVKYASDITAAKQLEAEAAQKAEQDAKDAEELQRKVAEILKVAEHVAQRDYSLELSVCGEDSIGQLGEGLSQFFQDKQAAEVAAEERRELEQRQAEDQSRKVAVVLEVVNAMADGDFNVEVPNLGDDAVGQVAAALETAMGSIRTAMLEVRDVVGAVSSAAEQLTGASREIANGAQTQASSLEETASSLEEITSTVKQNTDNAQQARQLANGSRDVAENGGAVVGDAVQAMSEINDSSKKIADIITTIDEIAFQTNLLALNAAVEAARAGEQGRGFAVVAAEVRNLAQRSASAAKEIKTLIQDSVCKVENGTELVNKSGETLREIVNSVKRVTDIVSEIAAASKEQLSGVEQVNKAVAQMDRVTQGNASQTEEMSGTAASLLSQSVQLHELVSQFKVGSDPAADAAPSGPVEAPSPAPVAVVAAAANVPSFQTKIAEPGGTFEF